VRPASHVRPGTPAHPSTPAYPASPGPEVEDAEVYVYRDTSDPSGHPAAAATEPGADEPDASYWYDLSGQESAPAPAETRGPFEPLVSSSRPPSDPVPSATAIKDFYLTTEAIGEQNVDRHFDQLAAQQRELISEYFRRSDAAEPGDGLAARERSREQPRYEARAGAPIQAPAGVDPALLDEPDVVGHRTDTPPRAKVVAHQPRGW
jgi:hypothetical protein